MQGDSGPICEAIAAKLRARGSVVFTEKGGHLKKICMSSFSMNWVDLNKTHLGFIPQKKKKIVD